jgi:nitrite reductase/ring-hydroxylating ferredoxin subunit
MPKFVEVAKKSEIADQSAKCVEVEGKRIALFNLGGEFYAIDDACTHRGGPLSEGSLEGEEVECPLHGAHFNIKSGEVTGPPAPKDVTKYTVRVTGDVIEIEVQG